MERMRTLSWAENTQVGYHEFLFKQGRETWCHSRIKSRATDDYIGEGGGLRQKKRYLATLTETTLHRVVL
jgi:hypothetical protein